MPYPSQEYIDQALSIADQPADDVVAQLVATQGGQEARKIFEVLIRNIDVPYADIPDYAQRYFESQSAFPADVDHAQIRRGQQLFYRHGPVIILALYCKSLPTCYLHHEGAPILAITGKLNGGEGTPLYTRRILETFQFLVDVMRKGNLEAGEKGISTTLRVRLIHAAIRHFTKESPDWKPTGTHQPINQVELVYTLFTFSVSTLSAAEQLGIAIDDADKADYYALWKLVGHFLGIDPALVPDTYPEAVRLQGQLIQQFAGSTDAGKALTQALIAWGREKNPVQLFEQTNQVWVNFFMGERHSEMLGVAEKAGCLGWIPKVVRGFYKTRHLLDRQSESRSQLGWRMGQGILQGALVSKNSFKRVPSLVLPADMRKAWNMD